ncbi:MAG: radical SAM protein [Desulfomonilaceae bacterium]|nr:radical SAM protein [Desulfomonilaceae bacterium]
MNTRRSVLLTSLINSTENMGLKSVHASLLERGHDSHILFYVSDSPSYFREVADFVREHQVSVVGISLMSRLLPLAAALTESLKKTSDPGPRIVWGGIHAMIDPRSAAGYADYVCMGEGESAFGDFLDGYHDDSEVTGVEGIVPSDSPEFGKIEPIADLDALPNCEYLPKSAWITDEGRIKPLDHQLTMKHNRNRGAYLGVLTSRGCPFSCSYCCNNFLQRYYGTKIRKRSPERVIQEIEEALFAVKRKFLSINVLDDCFTAHSNQWLETFCSYMKPFNIPLAFRAIPRFLSREKLRILRDIPISSVVLGLQSGSERTLREVYQRKHSPLALTSCAQLLDEHDIPAVYDVIVDNPYETRADIEETVKLVSDLPNTAYVSLFSLTFYKGTALYDKAKADGYPVDDHLTKDQDGWSKASPEVRALKVAALLNRTTALEVLQNPSGLAAIRPFIASRVLLRILEPWRHLRMLYLSSGRKYLTLLRLIGAHVRDYACKYFSLSRVNKQPH